MSVAGQGGGPRGSQRRAHGPERLGFDQLEDGLDKIELVGTFA